MLEKFCKIFYLRSWFRKYKEGKFCYICKEKETCCLDFHHIIPSKKILSVSKMVNKGKPKKLILREIRKCIVLCSNCHIKLHKGTGTISGRNCSYIEKFVIKLKNNGWCFCGEKNPNCLQFDHLRDKKFTIMEGIRKRKKFDEIKEEISKCVLICSNCHRKKHAKFTKVNLA